MFGRLLPVQYSIKRFQKFEISKKITFHIFPKISSNNILSLKGTTKL